MTGNKITDKATKVSRYSRKYSSDTVTNERENVGHDKIIHKERYISPEKRQEIIDNLKSYNQIKTLLQKSSLCN